MSNAERANAFPPRLRVKRRGDFQRAYSRGARAKGSILTVVVCENGLDHPRIGLSVGRVVWRSAVRRNRVRRVFREAFRLERGALPAGLDVILIPAQRELEPELAATRAELVHMVKKAARRLAERRAADGAADSNTGAAAASPAALPEAGAARARRAKPAP